MKKSIFFKIFCIGFVLLSCSTPRVVEKKESQLQGVDTRVQELSDVHNNEINLNELLTEEEFARLPMLRESFVLTEDEIRMYAEAFARAEDKSVLEIKILGNADWDPDNPQPQTAPVHYGVRFDRGFGLFSGDARYNEMLFYQENTPTPEELSSSTERENFERGLMFVVAQGILKLIAGVQRFNDDKDEVYESMKRKVTDAIALAQQNATSTTTRETTNDSSIVETTVEESRNNYDSDFWKKFNKSVAHRSYTTGVSVSRFDNIKGPFLETTWSQDDPYNAHLNHNCGSGKAPVGCWATAAGQVMAYYKHPKRIGNRTMDWDLLTKAKTPNSNLLTSAERLRAKDEVGYLMSHLVWRLRMRLDCAKSTANYPNVRSALDVNFQYKVNDAITITGLPFGLGLGVSVPSYNRQTAKKLILVNTPVIVSGNARIQNIQHFYCAFVDWYLSLFTSFSPCPGGTIWTIQEQGHAWILDGHRETVTRTSSTITSGSVNSWGVWVGGSPNVVTSVSRSVSNEKFRANFGWGAFSIWWINPDGVGNTENGFNFNHNQKMMIIYPE